MASAEKHPLEACSCIEDFLVQFVQRKFEEFLSCIEDTSQENVCELQKAFNTNGWSPDYNNKLHRLFYFVKYAIPYCIEYREIYRKILQSPLFKNKERISVLSVGCGAMLDMVGLKYAACTSSCSVPWCYHGVDLVNWQCAEITSLLGDGCCFSHANICNINFDNCEYDVIIFPKSISDISDEDLKKFVDALCHANLSKDIALVMSKRGSSFSDDDCMDMLCEALVAEYGYMLYDKIEMLGEDIIDEGRYAKRFIELLSLEYRSNISTLLYKVESKIKNIPNVKKCMDVCYGGCIFSFKMMKNIASAYDGIVKVNAKPVIYYLKRTEG